MAIRRGLLEGVPGKLQRRHHPSCSLVFRIGTFRDQHPHNVHMAVLHREIEGVAVQPIVLVGVGSVLKQKLDGLGIVPAQGKFERVVTVAIDVGRVSLV